MSKKALFLDRDGVINRDHGYTYKLEHLELLDGVIEGLQAISKLDFQIIIITNQSGIARGLFSINDLHIFMQGLISELSDHKIHITDYFFCPHYPDGKITEYSKVCSCRKPEPGMLFQAKEKYSLDFSKSILIGDNETDIRAADNANLFSSILINNSGNPVNTSAANEAKNLIGASEIIKHYNT
jgi:D-glycero-D-manno-heptose 1,7-bisphosphate phosphatase